MATILEGLQNARENLCRGRVAFQTMVGRDQLNNAVELLVKGYDLHDDVEELIGDGRVEDVPEKVD